MRRLFAGIQLDDTARGACAAIARRLKAAGFNARYEDASKLHITLAFLGSVADSRYDEVVATMHSAAASCGRFTFDLDKLAAFPHERKPRIAYIGAREQGAGFRALAERIQAAYRAMGFTFNDDPVAHVTIARGKTHQRTLPQIEVAPIAVIVDKVVLFESIFDQTQNTSRYEIRARTPLSD